MQSFSWPQQRNSGGPQTRRARAGKRIARFRPRLAMGECRDLLSVAAPEVPGCTRGLDFAANLAFVGLSQVRESAVFSGIPITERLAEDLRTCGVCAIDLATGQVVALLRFETAV